MKSYKELLNEIYESGDSYKLLSKDSGSSSMLISEAFNSLKKSIVYVVATDYEISIAKRNIRFFLPKVKCIELPSLGRAPFENISPDLQITSKRVSGLYELASSVKKNKNFILIISVDALLQKIPNLESVLKNNIKCGINNRLNIDKFSKKITEFGYKRTEIVFEKGDYALRGGLVDIFPPNYKLPIRIDMSGNRVDSIKFFNIENQKTKKSIKTVKILPVSEVILTKENIEIFKKKTNLIVNEFLAEADENNIKENFISLFCNNISTIFDYLLPGNLIVLDHLVDDKIATRTKFIFTNFLDFIKKNKLRKILLKSTNIYIDLNELNKYLSKFITWVFTPIADISDRNLINFDVESNIEFNKDFTLEDSKFKRIAEAIKSYIKKRKKVIVVTYNKNSQLRLKKILSFYGLNDGLTINNISEITDSYNLYFSIFPIDYGFSFKSLLFLTEKDFFENKKVHLQKKQRNIESIINDISSIQIGDFIVHKDYGVGRFEGLKEIRISKTKHDCFLLAYAGGDKIYVPVENADLLNRYGPSSAAMQLDKLGSANWQARKALVKKRLQNVAKKLISLAAKRQLKKMPPFSINDREYEEFCAQFPYIETKDQINAIEDILKDLTKGKPMDRVICGDVGFGKTEIAMRAAYVVASCGMQSAIIVPTTLLSRQHYEIFKKRFENLPIIVKQLSRFVTHKESLKIKSELQEGKIDIIIGTHALLQNSIKFKNLSLIIVDEEQQFGVMHKEKLREMRPNIHYMTLSATPIPRTLYMCMSGIRDLSTIETPPIDRLPIKTYVLKFDKLLIKNVILKELTRGGQCFLVCPKIKYIPEVEKFIKIYLPNTKYAIAHGQLPTPKLNKIISDFYETQYTLLITTTIIQSGIDIPNVNTLVVFNSDELGLSQLYQIRGRIGRSKLQGFSYFCINKKIDIHSNAFKRLQILQKLESLGVGFSLAKHDLDVRGAGNILGEEQSGYISEVGVELYQKMLKNEINRLQENVNYDDIDNDWSPQIKISRNVAIPEYYIPDTSIRLNLYRKLADLRKVSQVHELKKELTDRYGLIPNETLELLDVIKLKIMCRNIGIEKIDSGTKGVLFTFKKDVKYDVSNILEFINKNKTRYSIKPNNKIFYKNKLAETTVKTSSIEYIIESLGKISSKNATNI